MLKIYRNLMVIIYIALSPFSEKDDLLHIVGTIKIFSLIEIAIGFTALAIIHRFNLHVTFPFSTYRFGEMTYIMLPFLLNIVCFATGNIEKYLADYNKLPVRNKSISKLVLVVAVMIPFFAALAYSLKL